MFVIMLSSPLHPILTLKFFWERIFPNALLKKIGRIDGRKLWFFSFKYLPGVFPTNIYQNSFIQQSINYTSVATR